jgi:hypothetical protein
LPARGRCTATPRTPRSSSGLPRSGGASARNTAARGAQKTAVLVARLLTVAASAGALVALDPATQVVVERDPRVLLVLPAVDVGSAGPLGATRLVERPAGFPALFPGRIPIAERVAAAAPVDARRLRLRWAASYCRR